MKEDSTILPKTLHVAKIIFFIGIANFLTFMIISMLFWGGGTAQNGKIVDGVYYLGDHGFYHPVPPWVYTYSIIHGVSLCITHPAAMLAGLYYNFRTGKRPRFF